MTTQFEFGHIATLYIHCFFDFLKNTINMELDDSRKSSYLKETVYIYGYPSFRIADQKIPIIFEKLMSV